MEKLVTHGGNSKVHRIIHMSTRWDQNQARRKLKLMVHSSLGQNIISYISYNI